MVSDVNHSMRGLRRGHYRKIEAIGMLAVTCLHEHVADAFWRDRLDEDFIAGMIAGSASLDNKRPFSRARIIKITADDFLNRVRKSNHGGDTRRRFDFADSIGAQRKRGNRRLRVGEIGQQRQQ